MKSISRRTVLQQLPFFALGSNFLLQSCKSSVSNQNSVTIPHKPLKPIHIPASKFSSAPDGTLFGDGVSIGAKVRSEHTNGQFCCLEFSMKPKQAGPAPHLHKELDEIMRVLEGSIHVLVGDTVTEVGAGGWHVRPHGIIHTFWNAGDVPARFIDMYPNQDFLSYFEDAVRITKSVKDKGLALSSPEVQKLSIELDKKYGITTFPDQLAPIIQKYGLQPFMS